MAEDNDKATIARLEHEARIREHLDRERAKSDVSYAMKLVERIVFGMIALITIGVVGALLTLVLK